MKATKKPRAKRYISEDGSYLAIDDFCGTIHIGWFFPEENDFGAHVGDSKETATVPPIGKDRWECWIAYNAMKPFSDYLSQTRGFVFESRRQATLALQAANEALLSGAPWPEWAVRAKAAGWTPPKGWKP